MLSDVGRGLVNRNEQWLHSTIANRKSRSGRSLSAASSTGRQLEFSHRGQVDSSHLIPVPKSIGLSRFAGAATVIENSDVRDELCKSPSLSAQTISNV